MTSPNTLTDQIQEWQDKARFQAKLTARQTQTIEIQALALQAWMVFGQRLLKAGKLSPAEIGKVYELLGKSERIAA